MKKLLLTLFATMIVSACATASKPGAMVPEVRTANIISDASKLWQAVSVGDVAGGKDTNPLWKSNVSSDDFAEALRQSLAAHAMLSTQTGTYRLDANLDKVQQPLAGFNMTVTATVSYTLTNVGTGATVFSETVETPYTAKMGDAFVGVKRLQLANEGAIKENISTLMERLDCDRSVNRSSTP